MKLQVKPQVRKRTPSKKLNCGHLTSVEKCSEYAASVAHKLESLLPVRTGNSNIEEEWYVCSMLIRRRSGGVSWAAQ